MDDNSEKKDGISTCKSAGCPRGKLVSYNWLGDVPGDMNNFDMVEVLFKNTRKGYYKNSIGLQLKFTY